MADIINIKDRMKGNKGDKMFTLSFYRKGDTWTVDVDEISIAYDGIEAENVIHDIHVGVRKTDEHLRQYLKKRNKEKK